MSRFSYPSHVCEDRLAEMPAEEGVRRTVGIVKQATVQTLTSPLLQVVQKKNDLMPVLKKMKPKIQR